MTDVKELVGTWYQISHRHRLLARFPVVDGKPLEPKVALRDGMEHYRRISGYENTALYPHEERWLEALSSVSAGDQFLRVYATYRSDELQMRLTVEEFAAYRAAGGDTYQSYMLIGAGAD